MSYDQECAICFENCKFPVELPCSHVFCFLCIKGSSFNISFRCALCRRDVPHDYFDHPKFLQTLTSDQIKSLKSPNEYKWFYEGFDGWWMYDDTICQSLEDAFKKGQESIEVLTAGSVYIIDNTHMFQYRKSEPSKKRKVIRAKPSEIKHKIKGIAGVKATSSLDSAKDQPPHVASEPVDTDALSQRLSQIVNVSDREPDGHV